MKNSALKIQPIRRGYVQDNSPARPDAVVEMAVQAESRARQIAREAEAACKGSADLEAFVDKYDLDKSSFA